MTKYLITHDQFFKISLANPKVARAFFEHYLPANIKEKVNLNVLEMQSANFIENNIGSSYADALMKTKFDGNLGYLYVLIEQQTKPDKSMPFRLLKYLVSIWDQHIKKSKKPFPLPPVYPLVFYNGKDKYNAPLDLYSLVSHPEIASQFFNEPHQLINLQHEDDRKITSSQWLRAMISLMKHNYDPEILPARPIISPFSFLNGKTI